MKIGAVTIEQDGVFEDITIYATDKLINDEIDFETIATE
jgi:hypothetical protein